MECLLTGLPMNREQFENYSRGCVFVWVRTLNAFFFLMAGSPIREEQAHYEGPVLAAVSRNRGPVKCVVFFWFPCRHQPKGGCPISRILFRISELELWYCRCAHVCVYPFLGWFSLNGNQTGTCFEGALFFFSKKSKNEEPF